MHAGQGSQRFAQFIGRRHDSGLDHLEGDATGGYGGFTTHLQDPQGLDHAVPALRCHGARAREGGMGGVLRIDDIILASFATIRFVRRGYLQHRDAGFLQESQ